MTTLLTVKEAAEALRLSPGTVYEKVSGGVLRAWRLGDGPRAPLRISEDELERFLCGPTPEIDAELEQLRNSLRRTEGGRDA